MCLLQRKHLHEFPNSILHVEPVALNRTTVVQYSVKQCLANYSEPSRQFSWTLFRRRSCRGVNFRGRPGHLCMMVALPSFLKFCDTFLLQYFDWYVKLCWSSCSPHLFCVKKLFPVLDFVAFLFHGELLLTAWNRKGFSLSRQGKFIYRAHTQGNLKCFTVS